MNNNYIIGIVGGMGSVATAHFFNKVLKTFPAEKEWDRPRIIIDNRCDMPSRVRGILYNENVEEIVSSISESLEMLSENKCNKIILACNTSHYYLDAIYKNHPEFKNKIVNIIDELAVELDKNNIRTCCLLASEGTYLSKIYDKSLEKFEISYNIGTDEARIRTWIEAVKTYNITEDIKNDFLSYINNECTDKNIILGCTELPVLYEECSEKIHKKIFDPLECAINVIKSDYYDSKKQ